MSTMDQTTAAEYQETLARARQEIGKIMVGLDEVIEQVLVAVLSSGHVLLEGVPGLGKTRLVRTLSQVMNLQYSRIQFTPDLMPADITGTNILMEDAGGRRYFEFQPGPLFSQVVLADEINRATSKTQSALLEAMQEHAITVAGRSHPLEEPFFVLATQNPLEMEGTYPLPEAQVDRFFFKLLLPYPSFAELQEIVARTTGGSEPVLTTVLEADTILQLQRLVREIPIAEEVTDYALRITMGTHPEQEAAIRPVKQYIRYGSSPRGAQALILAAKSLAFLQGRYHVSFADIRAVALPALRHRLLMNFEGESAEVQLDALIGEILTAVPEKG